MHQVAHWPGCTRHGCFTTGATCGKLQGVVAPNILHQNSTAEAELAEPQPPQSLPLSHSALDNVMHCLEIANCRLSLQSASGCHHQAHLTDGQNRECLVAAIQHSSRGDRQHQQPAQSHHEYCCLLTSCWAESSCSSEGASRHKAAGSQSLPTELQLCIDAMARY